MIVTHFCLNFSKFILYFWAKRDKLLLWRKIGQVGRGTRNGAEKGDSDKMRSGVAAEEIV